MTDGKDQARILKGHRKALFLYLSHLPLRVNFSSHNFSLITAGHHSDAEAPSVVPIAMQLLKV